RVSLPTRRGAHHPQRRIAMARLPHMPPMGPRGLLPRAAPIPDADACRAPAWRTSTPLRGQGWPASWSRPPPAPSLEAPTHGTRDLAAAMVRHAWTEAHGVSVSHTRAALPLWHDRAAVAWWDALVALDGRLVQRAATLYPTSAVERLTRPLSLF